MLLYDGVPVEIKRATYLTNETLAVVLVNEGTNEIYKYVTINIDATMWFCKPLNEKAFVDTNNLPNIEKFLVENDLAKPANIAEANAMWEYPLYCFNLEKIPELPDESDYDPDGDFVVEVEVQFYQNSHEAMSFSLNKKGIDGVKDDVLPEVAKRCKENNIEKAVLCISVTLTQDDEWVDSDDAWFSLNNGEITMSEDPDSDDEEWYVVADEVLDFSE